MEPREMNGYICFALSFPRHRKTLRLREIIGERAFWVPPFLWAYAAEHQKNGNFSDYDGGDFARIFGVKPEDGNIILDALKRVKFLTAKGVIHDWRTWNKYFEGTDRFKKAAKARYAEEEAAYKAKGITREQWLDLPRPERRGIVAEYRARQLPGPIPQDSHTPAPTAAPAAPMPTPGQMMSFRERKKAIAEQMENHVGNPKCRAFDAQDKIAASAFRALKRDYDTLTEKLSGHSKPKPNAQ